MVQELDLSLKKKKKSKDKKARGAQSQLLTQKCTRIPFQSLWNKELLYSFQGITVFPREKKKQLALGHFLKKLYPEDYKRNKITPEEKDWRQSTKSETKEGSQKKANKRKYQLHQGITTGLSPNSGSLR